MIFIFYFKKRLKEFDTSSSHQCPCCKETTGIKKIIATTWLHFFFIPIIPLSKQYLLFCPKCKRTQHLTKSQFLAENYYTFHFNKYEGKTRTQIAYIKEMEEFNNQKNNAPTSCD